MLFYLIGLNGLRAFTPNLKISRKDGTPILEASEEKAFISSKEIIIKPGKDGLKLKGNLLSQKIFSGAGNKIELASMTDKLSLKGPTGVDVRSFAGNLTMKAFQDLSFRTKNHGKVSIKVFKREDLVGFITI